ncbi:MAG: dTDP-4-dehydrorhamnose reductase [Candidatus Magasanikbacteria bacterium GW2011_GWA2_45_39]|nr:MAG: dTDP-4-dehydrorhamnose reductase [Candidatus Magasanikbacteria bacterium GW2011_GWA2_45_39]
MLGQQLETVFRAAAQYEVAGWDRGDIDITEAQQTREKIIALKPDIIINAAAYNNVDKAETDDKELAMRINGEAVGTLAAVANELGALLVHYSSDYVFAGDAKIGYKEIDEPSPISVYGESKLAGEKAARTAHSYYLLRTSRLFGPPASGVGAKKSFVDVMLALAKEKKEFDLVDEEWSSPTYVADLAKRTKEIIEQQEPYGLYHVTNSGACTWFGFGKEVFKLAGLSEVVTRSVSSSSFPRPAKRPAYSELTSMKLHPMRPWQDALKEYIEPMVIEKK